MFIRKEKRDSIRTERCIIDVSLRNMFSSSRILMKFLIAIISIRIKTILKILIMLNNVYLFYIYYNYYNI